MEPYNQNEGENKIFKENLENQAIKKEEAPLVNSKIPKIVISLIIFLAVVVLIFVINKVIQKNDKNKPEDDYLTWKNNSTTTIEAGLTTTTLETATTTQTAVKKTITKKIISPTKPASTSLSATNDYLKARNTYQTSGYYFQFLNCKGTPGILTVKKGAKLMLDNRDDKTRKIVFIGKLYNINAYGYVIVTADKLGKHYITCDGGGAAQITVQP